MRDSIQASGTAHEVYDPALEPPQQHPLRVVHRQLRGRYRDLVLLALVLGCGGAVAAFGLTRPLYRSTGMVQVMPTLPSILYRSEENSLPPMFDSFVLALATMLESREVLDGAMARLQGSGWPEGPAGLSRLEDALRVEHGRGEQVISVSAVHEQPELARAAVNAVMSAFVESHNRESDRTRELREERLVEHEADLARQLATITEQMLETSDGQGAEAIDRLYTARVRELEAIDLKLADLGLAETIAALAPGATGHVQDAAVPGRGLDDAMDPEVQGLRRRELALQLEIDSLAYKFRPNHPVMVRLGSELDAVRLQIRHRQAGGPALARDEQAAPGEQTERTRAMYAAMREQLAADVAELGRRQIALEDLELRSAALRQRLEAARQRLAELHVEGDMTRSSRVSITAMGDLPIQPSSDYRGRMATVGGIGGVLLAVAVIFIGGRLENRCRFADELHRYEEDAPLLGVIPDLASRRPDVEMQAAMAFHRLRNVLETSGGSDHVYAVTGPSGGEGKTSVTLALAASFAAVELRTLIVDIDVVGQGATRQLRLQGKPGLCQAIDDPTGPGCVHETTTEHLWALPTGTPTGGGLMQFTPAELRALIAATREKFDVVVIDTGPILESLEATLVAATAAQCIVVASRDRKLRDIETALDRLRQAGARCAGIVLNRAAPADCQEIEAVACRSIARAPSIVVEREEPALYRTVAPGRAASRRDENVPV